MDVCGCFECDAQGTRKSRRDCKQTREYQFEMSKWEEVKLQEKKHILGESQRKQKIRIDMKKNCANGGMPNCEKGNTFWEKARENRNKNRNETAK